MTTIIKFWKAINLILLILFFSCENEQASDSKITSNLNSSKNQEQLKKTSSLFSITIKDKIFNYQESKKSSFGVQGTTFGQTKCSLSANWETDDTEYVTQIIFNEIPEAGQEYQSTKGASGWNGEGVLFQFIRTKIDDFSFQPVKYIIKIDQYEYENINGVFFEQKLSGTIQGEGKYKDSSTMQETLIPFEAKFQFAE